MTMANETELHTRLTELKAFLQALDFEIDGRMIATVDECIKLSTSPDNGAGDRPIQNTRHED